MKRKAFWIGATLVFTSMGMALWVMWLVMNVTVGGAGD